MKIHTIVILLLILMLSNSCGKKEKLNLMRDIPIVEMPPYTETGANTFACKVNGEVWVAQVDLLDKKLIAWYSSQHKTLGITGYLKFGGQNQSITFNPIQNVVAPGEFSIGKEVGNTANYYIISPAPERNYRTKDGSGGKFILKKLDTINHICSGTFYFDAVSTGLSPTDTTYKKGEVVHITEGQFDFKY